jgi:predicted small integral membrane protein
MTAKEGRMKHSKAFRWLSVLLIFPFALREWIDVLTDIGSFQGNVAMIGKIVGYKVVAPLETVFDRSIHSELFNQICAVGFILVHLVLGVLLTTGMILMIVHINKTAKTYARYAQLSVIGLGLVVVSYMLLFGVVAMDYFMAQAQQIDFSLPIICSILPAAIALFFILVIDRGR